MVDAGNSFEYDFRPSDNALGIDVVQSVNSSSYAVTVSPSGGSVVGTWTPRVTVTDPYGASITVSGPPITIFDAEPSLALEGCTVDTGSWCQVRAVVSDPDDDTASVDWPSVGEFGVPSGANRQNCADPSAVSKNDPSGAVFQPATCQYRLNTSGTHTITVTATSGGKQVSNTATITFRNQDPTLSVSVLSGGNCDDAGHSGTSRSCTLRATASDPEPGTLTFTFPTISGLSRSGACNGSVSHAGGTNVTRDCTYTWSVPDSSAANRTRPPESSSWTLRANPLNKNVSVRDADGATISRTTPSGFRYRAIANREIPVVSITCSGGGNTVSGAGTLTVAASTTVSCGVSASDPDGISHTYWTFSADLNHNTCKSSSGRYLASCEMSGSNQSITVYNTARDFYCSVKPCQGGSDGSRVGASGIITVVWQAPPSGGGGGGGCSPKAAVTATPPIRAGSYTSGGRTFSIFGLGAKMTHCNNATRSVVLTAYSVSGARFGAPGGIPTGNFNDILAQGSHHSGIRICQSAVCVGPQNMFVYFRVRQECTVNSSVTLTIEVRDGQYTLKDSRNVSVPADLSLTGCDGRWV